MQLDGPPAAGFRPPADDAKLVPMGRPGHSLLLAQEKVTKEKGTPRGAVWAAPSQSVSGGRAFRPGSCPDEKCPISMSGTPSGPDRPPLTATQGLFAGSCRFAAHRVAEIGGIVRCGSAPSTRPRTGMVASIRDDCDGAGRGTPQRCGRALGALLQR